MPAPWSTSPRSGRPRPNRSGRRAGLVRPDPRTRADWRARPLWDIIGRLGLQVGLVRWPVTFPAQPVRGVLVTDRFHTVADSPIPSELEEGVYPPHFVP